MNSTQLNNELNTTALNPANGAATSINTFLDSPNALPAGTVLLSKYTVEGKLDVNTGEADLYLCGFGGNRYIAKVYRREAAVKNEIIEKLQGIDSPYVASSSGIGTYNGFPFEIMPYYKNGSMAASLSKKHYEFRELKETVIPQINEALHTLHTNGIIHKDLKPSNIMIQDDGKSIALIDFGVSSVIDDNNTVIVTRTGMTPEYSAPEASFYAFLEESDYYSLGITVYELFAGYTPFKNMTSEQKVQFAVTKEIPFPEDMPEELKALIQSLTYIDVTHRNDKTNPNRRWTYEEVKNWCQGKSQPVPGESSGIGLSAAMPPYSFLNQRYTDMHSLVTALANHWEEGKKQLFRGLLSGFFRSFNPELAGFCIDAEEQADTGSNNDRIFFGLLYQLDPDFTGIYWHDRSWNDPAELGEDILRRLRNKDYRDLALWDDLLRNKVLTSYAERFLPETRESLQAVEAEAAISGKTEKLSDLVKLYTFGYLLSGDRTFHSNGRIFRSPEELIDCMKEQLNESPGKFKEFCKTLIHENATLDPQFEAWLKALGKSAELSRWKKEIVK